MTNGGAGGREGGGGTGGGAGNVNTVGILGLFHKPALTAAYPCRAIKVVK
jgi:hypothetical protein